jgi:hypothetical protein
MNNDEEKAGDSVTEPERGFASLPPELKYQVFKNLPTIDPNETARNINSFRRINRDANKLVTETPPAERFVGRVKRLGETAKDIYDAAIPKGALHEESAEQPGDTYSHVAVGASVQGFRPLAERAELAAKVSDLSDRFGVRAEASIPLIASAHTDPKDRDDLIEGVARSYKRNRTGYSWAATNDELREPALYALKEAHERNHLSEDQKAKLPPGTLDRQKPDVWGIDSRPHFGEGREFKDRISVELNAAPKDENKIDRKIDKLTNEFRSLSRELPHLQDHSVDADNDRSKKFEKLDVIANHIPESYAEALDLLRKDDPQRSLSEARAQLKGNQRSRDRQGYGR